MAAPRKGSPRWAWANSIVALLIFLDLCVLTQYLWRLPTGVFNDLQKTISTVAGWVVSLLGFLGIRHVVGKRSSIPALLRLKPVVLCTLAGTAGVWFFALPVHSITLTVRNASSGAPVPWVAVTVDGGKWSRLDYSSADGELRIGALLAANHDLLLEAEGYSPQRQTATYLDVLGFGPGDRQVPLKPVPPPPPPAILYEVFVSSDPDGAEIFVSGSSIGVTPGPIRLAAGSHTLELRKPGYQTKRVEIRVPERQAIARELTPLAAGEK